MGCTLTTLTLHDATLKAAALAILGAAVSGQSWAAPPEMHLDLRPPSNLAFESGEKTSAFPSRMHSKTFGNLLAGASFDNASGDPSAVLATSTNRRTPSRIEELAVRMHHDGIPLARLWENKSALISLGLNGKGKPGLWLTQKIH